MRLVLVKGSSQYGSLRLHIDQLAAALAGRGHDTVVIDATANGAGNALNEALSVPTQGLITFNGMLHDTAAGEMVRKAGCVFVSLFVDHPIYHLSRLDDKIAKQALFFLDRTHVEFMAAWGAGRAFKHVALSPPGANELADAVDVSDEAFARRDIPILFTGTYRGPPTQGWRDWPDSPARQLVGGAAERMAADGRLSLLDALRASLAARKAMLSTDLLQAIAPMLHVAQQYAEAYHRHAVLTALGAAGVPIQVSGLGWEPLCAAYPTFSYLGIGSFEETLHLLRRARIVLNINNGFIAGGHERVFTAMCAGACVFSETSQYYAAAFKEGEEMATFSLDRLDRAPGQLLALMADLPAQAAMARAGHHRAMADHRWLARADEIVKAVGSAL